MNLALGFGAETQAEAEAQALAWADAEPNVESARIIETRPGAHHPHAPIRWTVTLHLVMREADSLTLGLVA